MSQLAWTNKPSIVSISINACQLKPQICPRFDFKTLKADISSTQRGQVFNKYTILPINLPMNLALAFRLFEREREKEKEQEEGMKERGKGGNETEEERGRVGGREKEKKIQQIRCMFCKA